MLDLQPIKDRLAAATPGPWNDDKTQLVLNAPSDLAALVAEVERLRERMQDLTEAIGFHRLSVGPENGTATDESLWEVLDA